jgi:predicted CoA-binding protein
MSFKEKYGPNVAVVGASADRSRYSNKAVRAFLAENYTVFPINPKEEEIEGLRCHKKLEDIPGKIDFASIYLNAKISLAINLPEQLRKKGARMAILNPGAESDELIQEINTQGIETQLICSIRALGKDPEQP